MLANNNLIICTSWLTQLFLACFVMYVCKNSKKHTLVKNYYISQHAYGSGRKWRHEDARWAARRLDEQRSDSAAVAMGRVDGELTARAGMSASLANSNYVTTASSEWGVFLLLFFFFPFWTFIWNYPKYGHGGTGAKVNPAVSFGCRGAPGAPLAVSREMPPLSLRDFSCCRPEGNITELPLRARRWLQVSPGIHTDEDLPVHCFIGRLPFYARFLFIYRL